MAEDNIRFSITLSPYDFRKLKLWAKLRGRPPAAFAAQILCTCRAACAAATCGFDVEIQGNGEIPR